VKLTYDSSIGWVFTVQAPAAAAGGGILVASSSS
jgi:hypothetical protein